MLEESFFKKKFSIGLAMDTTFEEFNEFLEKYSFFIDNIYVSPPLGDQFHGRQHIRDQFHVPEKIALFWKLAELIQRYQISLEVVFNTEILTIEDFQRTKDIFREKEIEINKIAVFDKYLDDVKKIFPKATIVKTVNEMPNTYMEFEALSDTYDEIVVGRHLIRDKKVLDIIGNQLHAVSVLLLNNGCSFHCGGCRNMAHCENTYLNDQEKWSPEYLYAQQSILPFELHERYLDLSKIGLFKLSTRNADTDFTARCMESYIKNNAEELIREKSFNYLLWARLKWHIEHFDEFDYKTIVEMKRKMYEM